MEGRWLHGAACHGCALVAETSCEMRNDLPRSRARRTDARRPRRGVLPRGPVTRAAADAARAPARATRTAALGRDTLRRRTRCRQSAPRSAAAAIDGRRRRCRRSRLGTGTGRRRARARGRRAGAAAGRPARARLVRARGAGRARPRHPPCLRGARSRRASARSGSARTPSTTDRRRSAPRAAHGRDARASGHAAAQHPAPGDDDVRGSTQLVKRFADRFWKQDWPGERQPAVFYDPRSLAPAGSRACCMPRHWSSMTRQPSSPPPT